MRFAARRSGPGYPATSSRSHDVSRGYLSMIHSPPAGSVSRSGARWCSQTFKTYGSRQRPARTAAAGWRAVRSKILSETVFGLTHHRSDCRSQTVSVGAGCGQDWWSGSTPASKGAVKRELTDAATSSLSGNFFNRSCFRISGLTCGEWSARVRWRPSLSTAIVTQLGTRLVHFRCRTLASALPLFHPLLYT